MRGHSSVRIRVTVGQIKGYNTCDTLVWPTYGPFFVLQLVLMLLVTRIRAKKVGQRVTRIVGLFLGIATKSLGGPFFVK